jgi:tetratricopeptide (TPR) repeat protein
MISTLNLVDRVLDLGRRYQEVGRHRDALSILTRLAKFRHLSSDAAEETQARLADIYLKRRKYKSARRHLTAALRHQPDNARYHYLLAAALSGEEGGDLERAGEHFRRALELDPNHIHCLADYGQLLVRLGQNEEGLARLREAADRAPDDIEVLSKLLKALRLCGRTEEARSVLQCALFRNAHSPRFRKLWDEFRFHRARRRAEAERREGGHEGEIGEQPVLLPFVRIAAETETANERASTDHENDANVSLRPLRLVRRGGQRNAQ